MLLSNDSSAVVFVMSDNHGAGFTNVFSDDDSRAGEALAPKAIAADAIATDSKDFENIVPP